MKRAASIVALSSLLAGCVAGRDYTRPADAVIERPDANDIFLGANDRAFIQTPPPGDWWTLYTDPQLDALIRSAIAANTDLRIAEAGIERARADLLVDRSARTPTTAVTAAVARQRRSPEEELLPDVDLPAGNVYALGGVLSYQIDLAGQITRAIEARSADLAAARAAYDATRVTVVAETTRAYLQACSAGRELAVARRSVANQARSVALTRAAFQAGRGISLDVSRGEALVSQVRATLPALEATRRTALYRLAVLTGQTPRAFPAQLAACETVPAIIVPIPVGDGRGLLARRPDVRRAEWMLRSATARVGVVTADLYPKIAFGGSVGSVGLTRDALAGNTFKFSLGPMLTWEFPNRSRVRARIGGAEADVDAAYARFDGTVLTALGEVESALFIYSRDVERLTALRQGAAEARSAQRDAERLYRFGRQNYLAALDAERTTIAADQAVAAQLTRIAVDQVNLFLALGGGWQNGANQRAAVP